MRKRRHVFPPTRSGCADDCPRVCCHYVPLRTRVLTSSGLVRRGYWCSGCSYLPPQPVKCHQRHFSRIVLPGFAFVSRSPVDRERRMMPSFSPVSCSVPYSGNVLSPAGGRIRPVHGTAGYKWVWDEIKLGLPGRRQRRLRPFRATSFCRKTRPLPFHFVIGLPGVDSLIRRPLRESWVDRHRHPRGPWKKAIRKTTGSSMRGALVCMSASTLDDI